MNKRRFLIAPVALLLGFAILFGVQHRIDALHEDSFDEELLYLPNERLLNHFTGGLGSVVADLLWLRCIQYTARQFTGDRKFTWLDHMCRTITRLDPYFVDVYRHGGMFLAALKADDDASIELLKKGIEANPTRWELPYDLAMVYLLNRRDDPDSPAQAAAYLAMAVATGNAPGVVLDAARGLQMKHDLFDIERDMWTTMLEESEDDLTRDLCRRKLATVEIRKLCKALNKLADDYEARTGTRPERLADLDPSLDQNSRDSLGGAFLIDAEGVVRNTTLLDELVERRANRIRTALNHFKNDHGRWPHSLDELVEEEAVRSLPEHPYSDRTWRYNTATGEVS